MVPKILKQSLGFTFSVCCEDLELNVVATHIHKNYKHISVILEKGIECSM